MSAPPLTEQQVSSAIEALVDTTLVDKFPRIEKKFADPAIPLQTIGLFSFVPSKGATPDKDGVYGFAKIRGNFATTTEAMDRAELLIRTVDSYHQIYNTYVGRPFPVTLDPKYAAKVEEIDIKKKATEVISEDVKARRDKEKEEMDSIKDREKQLLAESKEDYKEDPYERYTVLKVKKAQLVWGYAQTTKQLEEMKKVILKTRRDLEEMDQANPEYKEEYFARYLKARRDAGIPDDHNTEDNFVKYMVEDLDLGF